MRFVKEHKKGCIAVLVLIVLIVIGVIASQGKSATNTGEQKDEVAVVERRTLLKSVSATGNFIAADEEKVTTDTVGVDVVAVNVEVGDTVAAGDTIAILDTTDLQKQLSQAQESLETTKSQAARSQTQAKRNLDNAAEEREKSLKQVDDNIATAKKNLDDAKATLKKDQKAYDKAVKERDAI